MPSRPSAVFSRVVSSLALLAGFVACAFVGGAGCAEPNAASSAASRTDTSAVPRVAKDSGRAFAIQSVTLDARRPPGAAMMERLQALGVTHLTLIPFGWQPALDVPEIRLHTDGGWYSESDAGIRAIEREADSLGMEIILKPHVWIRNGQPRDRVGFETEAEWTQWEDDYRRFLMHYARLAGTIDAAVLVVGTELHQAVQTRPDFWRGLIAEVRTVYHGKLTYAANWYGEYEAVSFWDALDYIGIQAYFPLTEMENPPLDTLRAAWTRHRTTLRQVAARTDRPVLFTELGYRSVAYAAAEPWRWPERGEQGTPALDLQARCYQAFFEVMAPASWSAGVILWKWHPEVEGRHTLAFTPQRKPAERVIRRWFTENAGPTS